MKGFVRVHGDIDRQLQLAHDFKRAVTENPKIIRSQLDTCPLLEMPEEWNRVTFYVLVHDAKYRFPVGVDGASSQLIEIYV